MKKTRGQKSYATVPLNLLSRTEGRASANPKTTSDNKTVAENNKQLDECNGMYNNNYLNDCTEEVDNNKGGADSGDTVKGADTNHREGNSNRHNDTAATAEDRRLMGLDGLKSEVLANTDKETDKAAEQASDKETKEN